jgi:hypothetical protein
MIKIIFNIIIKEEENIFFLKKWCLSFSPKRRCNEALHFSDIKKKTYLTPYKNLSFNYILEF